MASRSFSTVGIFGALATVAGLGFAATAMATPVLNITTSSGGTVPVVLIGNGSGNYAAGPGSTGGFSWFGIAVNFSSGSYDQLSVAPDDLLNNNANTGSNSTITLTASDSGLSASPNSFLSIQGAGSATASNAGASQTVDFSGSAVAASGSSVGGQDSGAISLHPGVTSATSTGSSYTGIGQNLSSYTGNLTLNTVLTLNIDPGVRINAANTTMSLNTTTVGTPEPATMGLFAVGGLALLAMRRRRMA